MKNTLAMILVMGVAGSAAAAEPVSVRPYSEVAIYMERQLAARSESLNEAVLAAEIPARVTEILVKPGETVRQGQTLLLLDDASFAIRHASAEARLEMAAAGLDLATLRAERARQLAGERFVSDDQLLEAETRLRQARGERATAEQDLAETALQLERTRISAPFDGVVSARRIGLGALASAGTPLLELIALDEIEVVAGVNPELRDGLERARDLRFVSKERTWPIRLARLSPVIDRSGRQQEARFVFVGTPAAPGSEGRIVWTDPRPALPADYIVQRNGRLGVLVLSEFGDQADFIELPRADAGRPLLVDLPADRPLIDEGRRRLQPGDPVRLDQ